MASTTLVYDWEKSMMPMARGPSYLHGMNWAWFRLGVHLRGRVEEPGAQDLVGLLGVALVAGVVPGQREVVRRVEDLLHVLAVGSRVDLGLRCPSRWTYGQPQGLSAVGVVVGHQ